MKDRNGFCWLVDLLPNSYYGRKAKTNTATAVAIITYIEREGIDEIDKIEYACLKMFGLSIEHWKEKTGRSTEDFVKCLDEFLNGAPRTQSWAELHHPESVKKVKSRGEKCFDIVQDSGAIIASFRQVYGLSLDEVCDLHWWEFLELLQRIPSEGNAFADIYKIRSMKPKASDSAEYKAEIAKAKRSVALKDTRSPEKKAEDRKGMFDNIDL